MKKNTFLILFFTLLAFQRLSAQKVLPEITVKDFNGKIIVSWQNAYTVPVTNISIQRSYDSTKNFSSIGSVLNPQNMENGFADDNPPYNKMYYRVFIGFEGGSYLFSSIERPVKIQPAKIIPEKIIPEYIDTDVSEIPVPAEPDKNKIERIVDSNIVVSHFPLEIRPLGDSIKFRRPNKDSLIIKNVTEIITYPSQRIYTGRENNIVIHLKNAAIKKYSAKFFDGEDNLLFELTKLREEYLILEKVNFMHSGWFHFELYETGKLIEKNKFFIGKDVKINNDNKRGSR